MATKTKTSKKPKTSTKASAKAPAKTPAKSKAKTPGTDRGILGLASIEMTVGAIRARLIELESGIDQERWTGDKLALAKKYLTHYRYHLAKLQGKPTAGELAAKASGKKAKAPAPAAKRKTSTAARKAAQDEATRKRQLAAQKAAATVKARSTKTKTSKRGKAA